MSKLARIVCMLIAVVAMTTVAAAQSSLDFVVSGRLTDSSGKPIAGPVALDISFFHEGDDTGAILSVKNGFESVLLQEGIFQVRVTLSAEDYSKVFPDPSQRVWFQVTDLTHGG